MAHGMTRFSVSLEPELLAAFDEWIAAQGVSTRSEAIKQLMRGALVEKKWTEAGRVAGALVLMYDHHRRDLVRKLMDVQHEFGDVVMSTQHVHLDRDTCMEVVTLKGEVARIRALTAAIQALKGLKLSSLVRTATE